jgi:UDP-N-acetylmuramoylalanine--D-glutamate ligase
MKGVLLDAARERRVWYEGRRALVLGMARSGIAAARLLRRHGCRVAGLDVKVSPYLEAERPALQAEGIELRIGPHDPGWLADADLVVVSPGVRSDLGFLEAARGRGLDVLSEIEVAFAASGADVIAITGTNGKSTTTAMTGSILAAAGWPHAVAGNIGLAYSAVASQPGTVALEVSSFQLENIRDFHAKVAVLLNITPDHQDRYPDVESYARAKAAVFRNQTEEDSAIVRCGDVWGERLARGTRGRVLTFGAGAPPGEGVYATGGRMRWRAGGADRDLMDIRDVGAPGPHNVENAMAAAAACLAHGVPPEAVAAGLASYRSLEHRLEPVAELGGVRYVNDSKATNIDSMRMALLSYEVPVLLIAGGRDKGADWGSILPLVRARVRVAYLIGEAAEGIAEAWPSVQVVRAGTLAAAVRRARDAARPGDVVLLSPGCASFDQFKDYEDRGRSFKAEVHALEGTGA